MQISQYPLIYNKNLLTLLKVLILVLCMMFIREQMMDYDFIFPKVDSDLLLMTLSLVFLLMPLNWYLEGLRWKVSLPFEQLSVHGAIRTVLSGLALNWIIPFTGGDVASRLLEAKDKKKTIAALGFNRIVILGVTAVYGGIAAVFYFGWSLDYLTGIIFLLAILGAALLFSLKINSSFFRYTISFNVAFKVIALTMLRYVIFTTQFFILLNFFNPNLSPMLLLLGIGWIFLFRSFIPSLFGNLGVREASSVVFFQEFVTDLNLIIFPCLIIWVINTVIPSIIGLLSIATLQLKLAK